MRRLRYTIGASRRIIYAPAVLVLDSPLNYSTKYRLLTRAPDAPAARPRIEVARFHAERKTAATLREGTPLPTNPPSSVASVNYECDRRHPASGAGNL